MLMILSGDPVNGGAWVSHKGGGDPHIGELIKQSKDDRGESILH